MILNEEQRLLQDTVADFLKNKAPVARLRELRDRRDPLGYSSELWQQLVELELPATALPEADGGLGFGFLGLGAVMEEMGKNLSASPLLSTVVLGASALELGGSEAQRQSCLPAIVAGELTIALAIDESHHHQPLNTALRLESRDGQLSISGRKVFVVDGHCADKLLVLTRSSGKPGSEQGLTLVLTDRKQPPVRVQRTTMMDGRNAAIVDFETLPVNADDILGRRDQAWPVLQQVLDRGVICLAAEMLGGAEAVFQRTIRYISEREQFDVKIGSFQALQHRCSQMYCQLQLCRSAVQNALCSLDRKSRDISLQASLAKTLANNCYQHISNEAVQMHGGMGVTDELDIGLFLKRARVCIQLLGDSSYHKDRYASLLGY